MHQHNIVKSTTRIPLLKSLPSAILFFKPFDKINLYSRLDQILLFPQILILMSRSINLTQLSAILQKKDSQESRRIFPQSSHNAKIRCPLTNNDNYQCMVCNRLRKACPFTRMSTCQHIKRNNHSKYFNVNMNKSNISTNIGDRNRTFSHNQSQKISEHTRQSYVKLNQNNNRPATIHTVVNPTEEIIYYPVIHNKIVYSPAVMKENVHNTPSRMKHSEKRDRSREVDIDDDIILTPTQFKGLMDYLRKE